MTASSKSDRTDAARRDLEEALVRLRLCKPNNPKLAKLALLGKLRVTVASVAEEAGRSRTLIGTKNCRFPDIRERIVAGEHREDRTPRGLASVVKQLRADNAELRRQIQVLRSQQALMLARMLDAERDAEFVRNDLEAVRHRAVPERQTGTVLPLPVRPKPPFRRGGR